MEQIKIVTAEQIINKVKRLQNGDISRGMKRMGISYDINYGVSLPQLRQIANAYAPNNKLAFELFHNDIREAKVIATMLFDVSCINDELLLDACSTIDNVELIEQFSRNVFADFPELYKMVLKLSEGNKWQRVLALYSASWYFKIHKNPKDEILNWSIHKINTVQENEEAFYLKGLSFLLQAIASISETHQNLIANLAEEMLKAENISAQKLAEEYLWLNLK